MLKFNLQDKNQWPGGEGRELLVSLSGTGAAYAILAGSQLIVDAVAEEVADGNRDANPRRHGVSILPKLRVFRSLFECLHHRRTTGGLHGDHARQLASQPADLFQFIDIA